MISCIELYYYLSPINPVLMRRFRQGKHDIVVHFPRLSILVFVDQFLDEVTCEGNQECLEKNLDDDGVSFKFEHNSREKLINFMHIISAMLKGCIFCTQFGIISQAGVNLHC